MASKKGKAEMAIEVPNVDRLIHEPARFGIVANLYVLECADFLFIMHRTGLTFGNLSSHLSKLEDAGYIRMKKDYIGKKPHTMVELTEIGRKAFENYRVVMRRALGR